MKYSKRGYDEKLTVLTSGYFMLNRISENKEEERR